MRYLALLCMIMALVLEGCNNHVTQNDVIYQNGYSYGSTHLYPSEMYPNPFITGEDYRDIEVDNSIRVYLIGQGYTVDMQNSFINGVHAAYNDRHGY